MSASGECQGAVYIDARDLICPLPVLKARKALKGLAPGGIIELDATDPAAEADFHAFCESTGHELRSVAALDGGVTRFTIAKGAA